jgi:hypothetical protein
MRSLEADEAHISGIWRELDLPEFKRRALLGLSREASSPARRSLGT